MATEPQRLSEVINEAASSPKIRLSRSYDPPTREALKQIHAEQLWRGSCLSPRHGNAVDITAGKLVSPNKHANWGKRWERVEESLGAGVILCLLGRRGTGKTQMAALAIAQVCRSEKPAKYSTAMDFYISIRSSYRKDSVASEANILKAYVLPSLLVLDEVQERGETPWEDRMLAYLIDQRYQQLKDTLLISNQTTEAFAASVGASVVDRAREGGGVLLFDWESFRGKTNG